MENMIDKLIETNVKKITKFTKNLYEIASNENIIVYECDLGEGEGLYLYEKRTKAILLNEKLSHRKKQIVLAHELGHAILHTNERHAFNANNMKIPKEREANRFAVKLLNTIDFWRNEELQLEYGEFTDSDFCFLLSLQLNGIIKLSEESE